MTVLTKAPLQGEILGPNDGVCVIAAWHPLRGERTETIVPAGLSIAEIVETLPKTRIPRRMVVYLNGDPIEPRLYARVRPKAGTTLTIRALVEGGGAGGAGGGQNWLAMALMAVVAIAALVIAPWAVGALGLAGTLTGTILQAAIGGAITIGGSMLVQALFPPSKPQLQNDSEQRATYSIGGGRNQANPYGTIPQVLGFHRLSPLYAAKPYTEIVGDEQYLRMLFVWGYGPLDITDLRIGDTLLSQYEGVTVETRYGYASDLPITLMPKEAFEEGLNIELEYNDPVVRTSAADVDELSFDVTFPNGLYAIYKKNGNQLPMAVSYRFRYRAVGSGTWITALSTQAYENSKESFRRGFRITVPRGQYEMEVTRTSPKGQNVASDAVENIYLTAIRSSRNEYPIAFSKPLAITALRIRASSQLNGTIDTFNGLAKSKVTAWNGSAWVSNQISNNPADLFRHVLQSAPNARPVPNARIDLVALQGWAEFCEEHGFTFNMVREQASSVTSVLDDICAAGRAVRVFKDGKWSVTWDRPGLPIVQHFTPRNSRGFASGRVYPRTPHGWRVRFLNETKNYQQDERIVYDDGYDKTNATLFEAIEFAGVTDPDLIWKHGRYHIAQARLRPETYRLNVDFENLVCTRGDRVRVTHDVPLWGQISGRVTAVDGEEVTLDEIVVMEPDKNYVARFRLANGSSVLHNVTHIIGEHRTILLPDDAPKPEVGDLMVGFGELNKESVVLRVLRIEPGEDMSANLSLVDDAPGILLADQGTIPPFDSQISDPVNPLTLAPQNIVITEFLFSAGAEIRAGARVSWQVQRAGAALSYEVQIRADSVTGSDWRRLRIVPAPQTSTTTDDLPPGTYSFRVRTLFGDGTASGWTESLFHVFQGLTAPPPNVTGFRIASLADIATLSWDPITVLNLSHYEIRYSPLVTGVTWGSASALVPRASGTQVQIPNRIGTYLIKAVTRQEVYSANAAILTSEIAALANVNLVELREEAPAFAGVKDGVAVNGSFLQLAVTGGVMAETGTYYFAQGVDLGAVYTSRLTPTIDAFGSSLSDVMSTWASLAEIEALASADPAAWDVVVEVRMTNADPALGLWTDWEPLAITDLTARAFEFKAILTGTVSGSVTPVIRGLSVEVDMPDRVEAAEDIVIPAAGLRIDFEPPFKTLRGVALAVQDRASGDREQITAKDETGFFLRFFNASNVGVQRTVDWIAKGYGRVEE